MAYFLLFIVSFGAGFVVDNAGKFFGALFMGIFFPLIYLLFKQSNGEVFEMFGGWKFISITNFWLGFAFTSALGFFCERVIFFLLQ